MKKLSIGFILMGLSVCLQAQEVIAPLNPDFVKSVASKDAGFIPSTFDYSFDNLSKTRSAIALPAKYDMRDLAILTTPRDQSGANTCWSFATMDALQSVWARLGIGTGDFSTENLANCHGFDKLKNQGGTAEMALAYLSRFAGPVTESADPYINTTTGTCKIVSKADKVALLSQAWRLPQNTRIIKEMVYRYGGVFTGFSATGFSTYYNSATNCTYSPNGNAGPANHAGTIVGWDDDKVITIPSKPSPTNPGAWIIKNTYGTSKNEAGYYYASYEDYYVGSTAMVYPQRIEKEQIDSVYYYDKLGPLSATGNNIDSAITLSAFTATQSQIIRNVGVFTAFAGTTIDVEVYQTKTGQTLSGLLGSTKAHYCEYPGFYAIPVTAAINGTYYVKIKYKSPGSKTPVSTETAVAGFASPTIQPMGLQWIKYYEGENWRDVGAGSTRIYNLCVKVYAQNASSAPAFEVNKSKTCGADTLVFSNKSKGVYGSYEWNFGDGATPKTAITSSLSETVKVVYSSFGGKRVSLVGVNGAQKDSVVNYNAVEILNVLPLSIISLSNTYSILQNNKIDILAIGADSYVWNLPVSIANTTANKFTFLVPENGVKLKVTGVSGKCIASDSLFLNAISKCAPYDDIQDARALILDTKEGPFSNTCATWQTNEPIPPESACTLQNGWCEDQNKLENSLWFKFTAPSTGAVKIITSGFDNQIALYDAVSTGNYADILSGNPAKYLMLAANDDSSATQVGATIEKVTGLSAGKTYWVQMDGSYNGVEGSAYITVKTESTSSLDKISAEKYKIANPVKDGQIHILNAEDISQISIHDLVGKNLKRNSFRNQSTITLNVSNLDWGYYLLKIDTKDGSYCEKILVE